MRLTKIRVENFKCIEDSDEFTIGETTCLVGKNESGKTALLEALYKLNPVIDTEGRFEKREFPRRFWDEFGPKAKSLTTTWELDDDDVAAVEEELGTGSLASTEVVVTKGYSNQKVWTIRLDESAIVQALKEKTELTSGATERLSNITSVADLAKAVASGETKGEEALRELLTEEIPEEGAVRVAIDVLGERLPVFLYFPEYAVMPGRVAINDLTRKRDEGRLDIRDEIFVALLALVGNTPEDIAEITHTEDLIAELEGVSSSLSDEIFDYWSQNRHLQVDFKFLMGRTGDPAPYNEGWVFETRIRNLRHRATVNFDERSSGFTWFFSFLVWFSLLKNTFGDRLFLLLDEPGLSLHARAQGDLLRFFRERLVPSHQLIYTTHSPFMVDPDNLTSARTVEDVVTKEEDQEVLHGTKVGDRILTSPKHCS